MDYLNAIEEMTWEQARELPSVKCSDFREIIDEIDPPATFKIFKLSYPFGATILDTNAKLHIPFSLKTTHPIDHHSVPDYLKKALSYSKMPLGAVVKNAVEVYREIGYKVFSVGVLHDRAGLELGIWENFGWSPPYTLSAGARSLYMIPKITLNPAHKRMKRHFGINYPPPKRPFDHWHIFKEIASSDSFASPWHCEVIYFSKEWHEKLNSQDKKWYKFRDYILQRGWAHSAFGRKKVMMDFIWELASNALQNMGLKTSPYIIDTLKHIIFITLGGLPASRPAEGDSLLGPITDIQKAYIDVYGMKDYQPTIMQPHSFDFNLNKPVYYSMQTPTLLSSTPDTNSTTSNIDDIRGLQEAFLHFLSVDFPDVFIDNANFKETLKKITLKFYHGEMYAYGDIRPTRELVLDDPGFLFSPDGVDRPLAENGCFIKGCVKINHLSST